MDSNSDGDSVPVPKNFEQLRHASSKWNLKGDTALLEILENIHKDIVTKAVNTKDKCEANASNLSAASISLLNVNNRFSELCNTQFVENNVQEDDIVIIKENIENTSDLIISNEQLKPKSKDEEETAVKERISNSVLKSLKNLEELCEEIRISLDTDSDSEDDDANNMEYNLILRPKDPYGNTRLPYIIGSQKWLKIGHTDLQESLSEDDLENELESDRDSHFSNSDGSPEKEASWGKIQQEGKPLQIPTTLKSSDNQSSANSSTTYNSSDTAELDISRMNADSSTPLNKTIDNSITDVHHSNAIPAPQTLVKPSDFAAELARKLGTVPPILPENTASKSTSDEPPMMNPKISTKPKNDNYDKPFFKPAPRIASNIFLDEPPPLESLSENKTSLFESDDENSDDISSGLFGGKDSTDPLFTNSTKNKSTYNDLFNDIPDDDDNSLFNTISAKKPDKFMSNSKTTTTQKEIISKINKEISQKKPAIKKEITRNVDSLFNDSDSDENIFGFSKKSNPEIKTQSDISSVKPVAKKIEAKSTSLFDDISDSDSDLFGSSSKFKNNPTKKDPLPQIDKPKIVTNKPDISLSNPLITKKPETKMSSSLFDDSDSNSDIDVAISNKNIKSILKNDNNTKPPSNIIKTAKKKHSIFDDLSDSNSDIFDNQSDKKSIKTKEQLGIPNTYPNIVKKASEIEAPLSNVDPSISNIRETKIPPYEENVSNKPDIKAKPESLIRVEVPPIETNIIQKPKVDDTNPTPPSPKIKSPSLASGLFDDLPPPLTTSNTSDDGLFNEPHDLFTTVGKTIGDEKLSDPLFDDDVDIFSDVPPDYKSEPKDQDSSDLFFDSNLNENICGDNYADYPYFKKVNFVPKSSPDELKKRKLSKDGVGQKSETVAENKVSSSLFSDSDDDLFGGKKSNLGSMVKNNKSTLFDNSSDEDKLFNSSLISPPLNSDYTSISKDNVNEKPSISLTKNIPEKAPKSSLNSKKKEDIENISISQNDLKSTEVTKPPIKVNQIKEQTVPLLTEKQSSLPPPLLNKQPEIIADKLFAKPEEVDGSLISVPKKVVTESLSPQKLPKLNINVKALLPSTNKTISKINKTIKEESNAPIINNTNLEASKPDKKENAKISTVSFDENPKPSDATLSNDLVKNRAKIQVKRRPSSRIARHEAARKSAADIYQSVDALKNDTVDYTSSLPNSPEKKVSKDSLSETKTLDTDVRKEIVNDKPVSTNMPAKDLKAPEKPKTNKDVSQLKTSPAKELPPSTKTVLKSFFEDSDEGDLFSSSKKTTKDLFESDNKGAIKKKPKKSIFEDSDSDTDLFSQKKKKITEGKKSLVKPKSIFDDDDSDDLFFVPSKNSKITATQAIHADSKLDAPSKPLFDDDDDDDYENIFTSPTSKGHDAKQKPNVSAKKSTTLTKNIKKTGDDKSFEDPLSSFLNS